MRTATPPRMVEPAQRQVQSGAADGGRSPVRRPASLSTTSQGSRGVGRTSTAPRRCERTIRTAMPGVRRDPARDPNPAGDRALAHRERSEGARRSLRRPPRRRARRATTLLPPRPVTVRVPAICGRSPCGAYSPRRRRASPAATTTGRAAATMTSRVPRGRSRRGRRRTGCYRRRRRRTCRRPASPGRPTRPRRIRARVGDTGARGPSGRRRTPPPARRPPPPAVGIAAVRVAARAGSCTSVRS